MRFLTRWFMRHNSSPSQHPTLDLEHVSINARKVIRRLQSFGFQAYLIGGGVRDLLLGKTPKDFDIVTNAQPDEIKKHFRNAKIIGKRFRLVHLHFKNEIIEVSTFRHHGDTHLRDEDSGMIIRDNNYGHCIKEDALRRDFTMNAIYFDTEAQTFHDPLGGLKHLQAHRLVMIGDPLTRFQEDPVRLLRAVRFSAMLGLEIDSIMHTALSQSQHLLTPVSPARLFNECYKLLLTGHALTCFQALEQHGLLHCLFSQTHAALQEANSPEMRQFIETALSNTDQRIQNGQPATIGFLLAVFLWHPMQKQRAFYLSTNMPSFEATQQATHDTLHTQLQQTAIPRVFTSALRDIWGLQSRFRHRRGQRALRLLENKRFRAGYDFLLLRALTGEVSQELAQWWTDIQTHPPEKQRQLLLKRR